MLFALNDPEWIEFPVLRQRLFLIWYRYLPWKDAKKLIRYILVNHQCWCRLVTGHADPVILPWQFLLRLKPEIQHWILTLKAPLPKGTLWKGFNHFEIRDWWWNLNVIWEIERLRRAGVVDHIILFDFLNTLNYYFVGVITDIEATRYVYVFFEYMINYGII